VVPKRARVKLESSQGERWILKGIGVQPKEGNTVPLLRIITPLSPRERGRILFVSSKSSLSQRMHAFIDSGMPVCFLKERFIFSSFHNYIPLPPSGGRGRRVRGQISYIDNILKGWYNRHLLEFSKESELCE
jgi:hypothetical protein